MKFKVGDKVKSICDVKNNKPAKVVEVDKDSKNLHNISCDFFDGYVVWFKEEELELIEESKPIKANRLEELTTALNILGSLGIEFDVKIYAEINGKKVVL